MQNAFRPTIKGEYVNSHLRALRREYGEAGITEVQKRFGKPISFLANEQVPVVDEARILEIIVDMTSPTLLSEEEREIEAGRLHFRNFSTTSMWYFIRLLFGRNLKFLFMYAPHIARRVFRGIEFTSTSTGPRSVLLRTQHNAYPLLHFKGFFEQWMRHIGVEGRVEATVISPGLYDYVISWR